MPRRRPVPPPLGAALALATVLLLGCGEGPAGDRAATATPVPTASPSSSVDAAGRAPVLRTDDRAAVEGKRATSQPLVRANAIFHVAADGGYLAVSVGDARGSQLMVASSATSGPLRLRPAAGSGRIPFWATIHVGHDPAGDPVVSYPRCDGTGDDLAPCRAMVWSARTQRETPVEGFDQAGQVLEVAVDRGNAAVIASRGETIDAVDAALSEFPASHVWVRDGRAEARRLPRTGPAAIALHGDTLATIAYTGRDGGICGEQLAQLWAVDDEAAPPRRIATVNCGLGGTHATSADLSATGARLLIAGNGEDGHAQVLDYDAATHEVSRQPLGADVGDLAWLTDTIGIGTAPVGGTCADGVIDISVDRGAAVGECRLVRITRTRR